MVTIGKENFKINLAVIGAYSEGWGPRQQQGRRPQCTVLPPLRCHFNHCYQLMGVSIRSMFICRRNQRIHKKRSETSSSAMAERPRELDQRFHGGVNLRLNYRLKGYFSRHCEMTQFTLTHHMIIKPFLLLGLAAEYRSRRWCMRSTLRPTIRCL